MQTPLGRSKLKKFKKGCAGKIKHVSESAAEFYLESIRDFKSEIYHCSFCKNYHTTLNNE